MPDGRFGILKAPLPLMRDPTEDKAWPLTSRDARALGKADCCQVGHLEIVVRHDGEARRGPRPSPGGGGIVRGGFPEEQALKTSLEG